MANVKQKIAWLWQNLERILVILFFLTFTFNIRKVFLTPYSHLNGEFNEYMTPNLSWADALMITVIIIYTIKYIFGQWYVKPERLNGLEYKCRFLSIINFSIKNVPRETLLLLLFLIWSALSILWSQLEWLAFYRLITLIELVLFVTIASNLIDSSKWLNFAKWAIILNGVFQSILGIFQFLLNRSFGLHLLGESMIGPNIDGVAKILINGEKHIRAYGTLPHPNILGAFLLIPIFLLVGEIIDCRTKVPFETSNEKLFSGTHLLILLILLSGVLVTGSRSTLMGLIIGLIILCVGFRIQLGRLWNQLVCFSRKTLISGSILFLIISIGLVWHASQHSSFFSSQSINERKVYETVSYETITHHFIKGVGLGQFVFYEYKLRPEWAGWQYQPVHNVYLLIFSELGVISFALIGLATFQFVLRVWRVLKSKILTEFTFYVIIISFFPLLLLDHFFWNLKIGLLIFSVPLVLLFASVKHHQKNTVSRR